MNKKIVFDIGGSSVKIEVYTNEKSLLKTSFSTVNLKKAEVLTKIATFINENDVAIIGISTPCACNQETGYLSGLSAIPNWNDFNLYDELKAKLTINKKVFMVAMNDANAALLGELQHQSVAYKSAIQIAIGTGIGGAVYIDGKIITGKSGFAGEFGFFPMSITKNGFKNISELISSNALVTRFNGKYKNAKEVIDNIAITKPIFDQWLLDLALGIVGFNYFIDPEVVLISGGIANNLYFRKVLVQKIKEVSKLRYGYGYLPTIKFSQNTNSSIEGIKFLLKSHGF